MMKTILAALAGSAFLLTAGAVQALELENKSSAPVTVQITTGAGEEPKSIAIQPNEKQTASCTAQCTVKLEDNELQVEDGDTVTITADGKLEKGAMQGKQPETKPDQQND